MVDDPAPLTVYQSYRFGYDFQYVVPNLIPNASYTVRLDFAEIYWSAAGQRLLQGILGALRDRIPGLVGTGLAGDEARLGDQVGLGGILASMGFL